MNRIENARPLVDGSSEDIQQNARANKRKPASDSNPLMYAIHCLASLKLTVGLLIVSVFMIWVATLQQVESDIWDVKKQHFPWPTVYIPLYTFFPPAWLPEQREALTATELFGRPVGVILPSGFSLILAMIVNLVAAHSLRFRIQGTGKSRVWGWILTTMGLAVCTAVVLLGHSNGVQGEPLIRYDSMWYLILGLMFSCGIGMAGWGFTMPREKNSARIFSISLGVFLLGLTLVIWWSGSSINDSGMRILWQIAQCCVASLVLLVGLQFLFRRKAGVVLLHSGLLLLLGNEIWVVLSHSEQRVSGVAGDTVTYAYDIRDVEMALIQRLNDEDRIISVPSHMLAASAKDPDTWQKILDTDLEFRVLKYFQNSDFKSVEPTDSDNLATGGLGRVVKAVEAPRVSGISQDEVNSASAYVALRTTEGRELGTYLVSQMHEVTSAPIAKTPNVIDTGEQKYLATLWFKRQYKPYDIKINKVEAKYYPGTMVPREYATEFAITDHETGFEGDQRVWMNNPLRYRNETYYQSGYYKDPISGVESTTLQVVLNRGWMIPYLCCALVGIGLIAQFLPAMFAYLDKAQTTQVGVGKKLYKVAGQADVNLVTPKRSYTSPSFWGPVVAGLLFGLLFVGWGMPKPVRVDSLSLDGLARLPISYKGRIQPLDSLAQTMLRKSSGLDIPRSSEETMFGKKKYPSTRWLADTLFEEKSELNYQVYRIDNRQVLDSMKLPYRSGYRYSWSEVEGGLSALSKLEATAREKDGNDRTSTDKSILDLSGNIAFSRIVREGLASGPHVASDLNEQLGQALRGRSANSLPGVVPGPEADAPWLAANVARLRREVDKVAAETESLSLIDIGFQLVHETAETPQLAANVARLRQDVDRVAAEIGSESRTEIGIRMIHEALVDALLKDPETVSALQSVAAFGDLSVDQQKKVLLRQMQLLDEEPLTKMMRDQFVRDPQMKAQFDLLQYIWQVVGALEIVSGSDQWILLKETQLDGLAAWEAIGQAYRDRDQVALDAALEQYADALERTPASEESESSNISWSKVAAEYRLNGWSPFYLSTVMYLVAAVFAVFGMFAFTAQVRRFTWSFIAFAFAIHTVGLLLRIYISGRAPVTSIYSSALAIAWGMVISFLIIELGTRKGVANLLAGLTGFLTLLVAYGLSLSDDTFAVLQAVLDTQFWLWTHVTIIALGYILTMVAGFWAIWMTACSWSAGTSVHERKRAADITYGLICAATLLSFVGTVLGGLWADDSWGRFWGWDPKENGAAMIVLWNAAILHARWAGLIRFQGLAAMAIFGNVITAWSWFAVNELGVGLHAYGFTEGVIFYLTLFWISQFICMGLTLIPPAKGSKSKDDSAERLAQTGRSKTGTEWKRTNK